MSNAEVRCFADNEIVAYENFHRSMAKDIQNLPASTPNPVGLAMLGWWEIGTYIDYVKLMFIQRILSLCSNSIYRVLFIQRFFWILHNQVINDKSPIAVIIKTCIRYNVLNKVIYAIESGTMPSKAEWRKFIKGTIKDRVFADWRFSLNLYPKLTIFKTVVSDIKPICWWDMAKALKGIQISMSKQLCWLNLECI